ncbi:MAG: DNA repair protein RadC [Bacteroidales bacterium]|nr:DNA repair protein RadC [Bacteroidales bacterium]
MNKTSTYENKRLTIKDWSVQDRPREKYARNGAAALTDAELIAILFRTGNASESAVELAKRLLSSSNNSLNELSEKTLRELSENKGIGQAKAMALLTAFEIGRRVRAEKVEQKPQIQSSMDVVNFMQNKIAYLNHEEFWVLYLNNANLILKTAQISKGGITSTEVDTRIVMQEAVVQKATQLILCHNHPSGSVRPSRADINLTEKISKAAKIMDIALVDHIIIHREKYYSFAEEGRI